MDEPTACKLRRGVAAGRGPVLSCHTPGMPEGDASHLSTRGSQGDSSWSRNAVAGAVGPHPGSVRVPRVALWGGNGCVPELSSECLPGSCVGRTCSPRAARNSPTAAVERLVHGDLMFPQAHARVPQANQRAGEEEKHMTIRLPLAQGLWSEAGRLMAFSSFLHVCVSVCMNVCVCLCLCV